MDGSSSMPALGLAWSHCVNSRILLEKRQSLPTFLDHPESEQIDYNENSTIMGTMNQQSNSEDSSRRSSRSAAEVYGRKNDNSNNPSTAQQEMHCDARLGGSNQTTAVQVNREDSKRVRKSNRVMRLIFSPSRPNRAIAYDIVQQGIIGIQ